MADPKGNDPASSQPVGTTSGAVKPPVLDLTARDASASAGKPDPAKPDPKVDPKPATAVPPSSRPADKPRPDAATKGGFPFGATLAGGVLGLAGAYGLALAGYWPSEPVAIAPPDPRLAQFGRAIPELETVTQTTQSELAALNQRIAALETAEPAAPAEPLAAAPEAPAPEPVDLAPLQAEIAALNQRIDAIPSQPAAPLDLAPIQSQIADLQGRIDAIPTEVPEPVDVQGLT
ncbi:MAG: hypothetical protein JWP99_1778, partial [Devosia sp.]|nr:hypothetical protein [Devosia sp.]